MKNVLITGAAGLIGYNLTKRLVQNNDCKVFGVYHHKMKPVAGVTYYEGDLTEEEFCDAVTKNMQHVYHCAAFTLGSGAHAADPAAFIPANTAMNVWLLDAAHRNGVEKFQWYASTTGYPDSAVPVTENMMFFGNPYKKYFAVGWMKRYTEKLCEYYSLIDKKPMSCIVIRPSNVYGPGDKIDYGKSHVLSALVRKVIEKQNPIEVWGDGRDVRDFIYIDDFIDACILAMEKQNTYDPINVGFGEAYNVMEVLTLIKKLEGYAAPVKFMSDKPTMIPTRKVCIDKAVSILGWKPKIDLEEGLRRMIAWMKTELANPNGDTTI